MWLCGYPGCAFGGIYFHDSKLASIVKQDQGMSFWGGKGDTDGAEGFQVHVLYAVARCPSFLYLPDVLRSAASGLDVCFVQIFFNQSVI
ncbi:hypothetical protein I7I53_12208 [Histoplasma capsulatum var. duboisii H88]|uniref:Uncharacterized protein n=1 Tax=Ajellomyces capsulatus (strain H88) TaxID=544711 RepID=A0A8A1LXE2_AJEC8|nr:hypothetical protein I7I53_12208 [Histoplasma capsulatum var. duboisii H88]